MILFPNCKINMGLRVLRRRPDGYHDIETVMIPIAGWNDILEIVPSESVDITLTVTGNAIDCPVEKNLVVKACRKVKERFPDLPSVDIYLHKIIPDGAGLGGGSADASFTIMGLNAIFNLGINQETMATIAGELGADCPFFIYNRPMIATGTGTILDDIDVDLHNYKIAIVKPTEGVSTAMAYGGVTPCDKGTSLSDIIKTPVDTWQNTLVNDFEASVIPHRQPIAEAKKMMIDCGAVYASMTGSGSAVFGLFQNDKLAERAIKRFSGMTYRLAEQL